MERIRVLLVEDDPDWRRGLSAFLNKEGDMEVAAAAGTPEEALLAAREEAFDVVLMDIMLVGNLEGIRLTAEIVEATGAKVIMLTSLTDKDVIFAAFQAGAVDYIVKSSFAEIPGAVRSAYRNRSAIHPDAAEQMREEFRRLKQLEQEYKAKVMKDLLTPAELQILSLIDRGFTQTEMAEQLFISLRTVKVHINHMLRKLNGTSSKELARKAREMGII